MAIPDTHLLAWRTFLELHARVVRILEAELLAETELPLSWYDVLLHLHEAGGRMRMGELAEKIIISRSATTRFVERLESAGYLTREPSPEDRRGTNVVLTDLGAATLRRSAPAHLRGIEEHFTRHLSAAEAATLAGILGNLLDQHGGLDRSARPASLR